MHATDPNDQLWLCSTAFPLRLRVTEQPLSRTLLVIKAVTKRTWWATGRLSELLSRQGNTAAPEFHGEGCLIPQQEGIANIWQSAPPHSFQKINSAGLKPTENKYLLSTYQVPDTENTLVNGKYKILNSWDFDWRGGGEIKVNTVLWSKTKANRWEW